MQQNATKCNVFRERRWCECNIEPIVTHSRRWCGFVRADTQREGLHGRTNPNWERGSYHCASSNGLSGAFTLGLGSMLIMFLTKPASPGPPTRMFSGEPLSSVSCEAWISLLL